ncbi:MAG: hypothetical protein HYZ27_03195, partial [Deltaproteobacteria bacterium]|nr:hypothetical protein [Deltaproteobacteria bacterium]
QEDCTSGHLCAGGLCKLDTGQPCGNNGQCVEVCVDNACGPQSDTGGACDEPADCVANNSCVNATCSRDNGQACVGATECASGHCANSYCCENACDRPCEDCGSDGLCNQMPNDDASCIIDCDGLDSICRDYHDLSADRCAELGACKVSNSAHCTSYTNSDTSVLCRNVAGECDAADTCDGNGGCPDKKLTSECRAARADSCDTPESCDGSNDICPQDVYVPCGGLNYRSIGAAASPLWTGLCTSTSSTVTFNPAVPPSVGRGDAIIIGAETAYVLDVDGATRTSATTQKPPPQVTDATCAMGRAFATLQEWETNRNGDLVNQDRSEVGLLYKDGLLNSSLEFKDSFTDPDHGFVLEPAGGSWHLAAVAGDCGGTGSCRFHPDVCLDDPNSAALVCSGWCVEGCLTVETRA